MKDIDIPPEMWYFIKVLIKNTFSGGLAQLGERLPCKQEVTSSTLVFSIQQRVLRIKTNERPFISV